MTSLSDGTFGPVRTRYKCFAVAAALLMVIVCFQVLVDSATAVHASFAEDFDFEDSLFNVDEGNGEVAGNSTDYCSLAATDVIEGGSVNSYGVARIVQPATIETSPQGAVVTENLNEIEMRTQYGAYVISRSDPGKFSLLALDDVVLVSNACFVLETDQFTTVPSGGKILASGSDRLVTMYSVVRDSSNGGEYCGRMQLSIDFSTSGIPKITAEVLDIAFTVTDWRIVWKVVPANPKDIVVPPANQHRSLESLAGCAIPAPFLAAKVSRRSVEPEQARSFILNWSDAREGCLRVIRSDDGQGRQLMMMQVDFPKGVSEIDPYLVDPGLSSPPTSVQSQRKVFWYQDNYWLFYNKGSTIYYARSPDGISWSSQVLAGCAPLANPSLGFDVAQYKNRVIVGWVGDYQPYGNSLLVDIGTILEGKITWLGQRMIVGGVQVASRAAVTISSDGCYWFAGLTEHGYVEVFRAYDDDLEFWSSLYCQTYNGTDNVWLTLAPTSNGNVAFLEAWDSGDPAADRKVRIRTSVKNAWSEPVTDFPDFNYGGICGLDFSSMAFSAVAEPSGIVHLAYRHYSDGQLYTACFDPYSGKWRLDTGFSYTTTSVAMSLDGNDILHVFYVTGSNPTSVKHMQRQVANLASWTDHVEIFSSASSISYLTSWAHPVQSNLLAWSEGTSPSFDLKFTSLPIPFGSAGMSKNPWDREGLSPYGTYFSNLGQDISVGSGTLSLSQTDVSIAGRGDMNLGLSRIYLQPKYFWKSNGKPYQTTGYDDCPMGILWRLDLPWMDRTYVGLPGGQRYVVSWGNTGDPSVFENHESVHFTLREIMKAGPGGPITDFYELIIPDKERYVFNPAFTLTKISDLTGVDPANSKEGGYNEVTLGYTNSVLTSLTESWTGNVITLTYSSGMLYRIIRPDGAYFTFGYQTLASGDKALTSVTDPLGRTTTYNYITCGNSVLLGAVLLPTGGRIDYTYEEDSSAGSEVKSILVTSQSVRKNLSNALIRQTNFDYNIVSGRVLFANVSDLDETGSLQGWTEHIFQSSLRYSGTATKDRAGTQLGRSVTWYDFEGQPVRVDTYLGASDEVNYSEYVGYDDWGNVIFQRDGTGHESYYSYANTKTSNSFQGGSLLIRYSSGRIFYDGFDDWNYSDWILDAASGSYSLDALSNPEDAPALKIDSAAGGKSAKFLLPTGTDRFVLQVSLMTHLASYIDLYGPSSNLRFRLSIVSPAFSYFGSDSQMHQIPGLACKADAWYCISIVVDSGLNSFDLYIDGTEYLSGIILPSSGAISEARFTDRAEFGYTCIDNVKVYKSSPVTVLGSEGYVLELYDSENKIVDIARDGTLQLSPAVLDCPPGHIFVRDLGDNSFSTPMMDIWGGDVFSLSLGHRAASVTKTVSAFGNNLGGTELSIADDSWPACQVPIYTYSLFSSENEGRWSAADYPLSGTAYHESKLELGSHYHGFNQSNTYMEMYEGQYLTQYIWLTEGAIPQEIAVQYYFNNEWHRAFWGGNATGNDTFEIAWYHPELEVDEQNVIRMGNVPTTTGRWVALVCPISVWGFDAWTDWDVTGVIYGLVGGTARWDYTSMMYDSIRVTGLYGGRTAEMWFDNGTRVADLEGSGVIYPNASSQTFPASGKIAIRGPPPAPTAVVQNGTVIYASGTWGQAWRGDPSSGTMACNSVTYKDDGWYGYTQQADSRIEVGRFQFYLPADAIDISIYARLWTKSDTGTRHFTLLASPDGGTAGGGTWVNMQNFSTTSTWSWLDYTICTPDSYEFSRDEANRLAIWVSSHDARSGDRVYLDFVEIIITYVTIAPVIYESPWLDQICGGDVFAFVDPHFYESNVKSYLHHAVLGTFQWQTVEEPRVPQETYIKYNWEGNAIESKSRLGAEWVVSDQVYDSYGNIRWSVDPTDRRTITEYTSSDGYSYPNATRQGRIAETFEGDTSWTAVSHGPGANYFHASYSTGQSYSPSHSAKLYFAWPAMGADTGDCMVWKKFPLTGPIEDMTLKMYLDEYTLTDDQASENVMSTGIRIRLYDSIDNNYYSCEYWLACWYYKWTNHTVYDPHFQKIIWGKPQMDTWLNVHVSPSSDFNMDWGRCSYFVVELYLYATAMWQDFMTVFYDDLTINDHLWDPGVAETVSMYDYNDDKGLLEIVKDPLGRRTNCSYDALGRTVWLQFPDGSRQRILYDDTGNKVTFIDQLNHKTVDSYDEIGRLVKTERYGSQASNYSFVTYRYNWQDKVSLFKDELGHTALYDYDYLGRFTRTTNPDGTVRTIDYDDSTFTITYVDELGGRTQRVMDAVGNLLSTREYDRQNRCYWTNMTYDEAGNLVTVTDANGQTTQLIYDSLSRLCRTIYPDGYSDEATYDDAGRMLSKKDRSGSTTTCDYDYSGNLKKITSSSDTISYTYDLAGQRTNATNSLGYVAYEYNSMGRVKSLKEDILGSKYTLRFGYDSAGNQKWILYPNGLNISYDYDQFERVAYVNRTSGTALKLLKCEYNLDDTLSTELFGQNQKTVYSYDLTHKRDWVASIVTKNGSKTVFSVAYTYDSVGNVKTLTSSSGGLESYNYDSMGRMIGAWANSSSWGAMLFTYDGVGNRLTVSQSGAVTTYSYLPGKYNQLNMTTSGSTKWYYNYDRDGNQVWKNSSSARYQYAYNSLNQLIEVAKETYNSKTKKWSRSTLETYRYDANGVRARVVSGATTDFLYVGHEPISSKTGTLYSNYVYVNGHLKVKLSDGIYFYFDDALGSPWVVWKSGATRATSTVKSYKPFGTPYGVSGTELVRFAGELLDSKTGLYYVGARYLDPELGRWLALDPDLGSLSFPQTLNRYVYCLNNPLKYVDPTGTKTWYKPVLHKYAEKHPGSLDEAMYWIGFIPYGDTLSDFYYFCKAINDGDWGEAIMYGIFLLLPVGSSYFKAGGKLVRWIFKHGDDVPEPRPHIPPKPSAPLKQVDDVDDFVTMRHYTDATTARKIEETGYLSKNTWVGPSAQIKPGMSQNDITDLLALRYPSKAESYIDVKVRLSDLYIDPKQGIKAQPMFGWGGGGFQYRLANDVPIGNARFMSTFSG